MKSVPNFIYLIVMLFILLGIMYCQNHFIDKHKPEYSYYSVRLDSLQRDYCKFLVCSKDTSWHSLDLSKVKIKDLNHMRTIMLVNRYKDSLAYEAMQTRLFIFEESLKTESERIHADYACYLTKLQTWAAWLIGIMTFITLLITYMVKSDFNEKMKESKDNYEKWKTDSAELMEEVKTQERLLKSKLKIVEKANQLSLVLTSLREVNNERILFAAPELKQLIRSLLFRLKSLNSAVCEQLDNDDHEINQVEQIQILLFNYLSVVSVLEPLVNIRVRECQVAFSKFRTFVYEVLVELKQKSDIDLVELNRIFKCIQLNLEILAVEFNKDVEEDIKMSKD